MLHTSSRSSSDYPKRCLAHNYINCAPSENESGRMKSVSGTCVGVCLLFHCCVQDNAPSWNAYRKHWRVVLGVAASISDNKGRSFVYFGRKLDVFARLAHTALGRRKNRRPPTPRKSRPRLAMASCRFSGVLPCSGADPRQGSGYGAKTKTKNAPNR